MRRLHEQRLRSGARRNGVVGRGRTRELIEFARHHGFGREEVIQIIKSLP